MEQRQFSEISNPLNYSYSTESTPNKKANFNLSMNLINYDKKTTRKRISTKLEINDFYLPSLKLRNTNTMNTTSTKTKQIKVPFKMLLQSQTEQLINKEKNHIIKSKSNMQLIETIDLEQITNKDEKTKLVLPPILMKRRQEIEEDESILIETARKFNEQQVNIEFEKINSNNGILKLPSIKVFFKSEPSLDSEFDSNPASLRFPKPVKLPFVKLNKLKLSDERKKSARNMWFHYDSLSFTP